LIDGAAHQQQSALAYYVRLDMNSGSFSVVESNRFKQLTHISLQLRPGNDSSIKAYLASRLTHSSMTSRRLLRELASTKDQLNAEMLLRRDMTEELREFRASRDLDLHSVRNTHAEEVLRVQTQAAETLERSRESFQKQITHLRATSDEAAKLSTERIAELESALLNEKQERAQSDFKVRELSKGSENTGVERARLVDECTELRQSLRQSEALRSNLEKEVVKLQMKAENLALQISDREDAVSRAGELQRASEDAKRATEEQLSLYKNSLEAVTEKLSAAVAEIKKGNQEIARQQQEMGQLKDKLSMKSEVIRKQEALVQELRTRVSDAESAHQRSNVAASESKSEAAALQRELDTTKTNLTECMDNLARQNEVVGYLNRELTKCALGGGATPLGAESFRDDSFKENSVFMSPGNVSVSEREIPRTFSGGFSGGGRKYQSADSFIKSSVGPSGSTNSKVQAR
jgi:spindle assembly abnormal protein 6